jgi:hypothetical protein
MRGRDMKNNGPGLISSVIFDGLAARGDIFGSVGGANIGLAAFNLLR